MNRTPYLIEFTRIGNEAIGYVNVIEKFSPFKFKRIYWTIDTPTSVQRGNHAHKNLEQLLVVVSGEVAISLEDQQGNKFKYLLEANTSGLYVPPMYWRTLNFSDKSILLCLASQSYSESDYIRDYATFKLNSNEIQ